MRISRTRRLAVGLSLTACLAVSASRAEEPVRGLVRAVQDAWISTELIAQITHISRREGESFKRGDVLLTFDCDKYQTELQAARAEQEFNRLALDSSIVLDKRKAIGRFEVAQNRTKYDKAKAQAETLAVKVGQCTVEAPFDGKVAEMKAKAFETSNPSQPLMRLVNADNLEIELIVPSTWLPWLKPDSTFSVKIDETGVTHTAKVQRIAPAVDSISQTVKIMAVFATPAANTLPGMSLTADIQKPAN